MLRGNFILLLFIFLYSSLSAQYVTYLSDVKPILEKHCTGCHQSGDIGPMPLTTYEEAAAYGKMIQYVTSSRLMPPWYADTFYMHYKNERVLTATEIQTISDWVDGDLKEGAMPYGQVISKTVGVTVLPRDPDLVISMREAFEQYGIYMDQYQVFVLPTHLKEDKWIEAIEFEPGNKKIVRHADISVSRPGMFDSLDRWDPRYGYYSFGGLGRTVDHPFWYSWSPQQPASFFEEGYGKYLPAKSELIVHMHYGPTGVPLRDNSELHIWFAEKDVHKHIISAPLINPYNLTIDSFYIEADTKKTFHAEYKLPYAIELHSLTPQANLLCKSWEVYAQIPGLRSPQRLLKIKDWNFNWKETYRFEEPIKLPAGSVIHALAHYDNTLDNLCNPSDKPLQIKWGAHLFDELFFVHGEFVIEQEDRSDFVLNAPLVISEDTLPVTANAEKRGLHRFEIRKADDKDVFLFMETVLPHHLHTFDFPVSKLDYGNYVLSVFNSKAELVAQRPFVRMIEKGM